MATVTQYHAPKAFDPTGKPNNEAILKWIDATLSDGLSFLSQQRAYSDLDKTVQILSGQVDEKKPSNLSTVHVNKIKQDAKELIGHLANIRPITDYKADPSTPENQHVADNLNKCYRAWYLDPLDPVDGKLEEVLQYALMSKGYLEPFWKPGDKFGGPKQGRIALKVHGPRDVLPIQMPASHDIQDAYAVMIVNSTGINAARSEWSEYADKIIPDRSTQVASRTSSFIQAGKTLFFSMFGQGQNPEDDSTPFPEVDIYHIYIRDDTVNSTGYDIDMEPGTAWGYKVPHMGKKVPTGLYDPGSGDPIMRTVTRDECMMYPNRRLIIATKTVVLYDGPSFWWHGLVPLIPFELDKWVFEYLGYSVVRDGSALQTSCTSLLRTIDDTMNLRLRPPKVVDQNAVSQSLVQQWDTRQPNKTLMTSMAMTGDIVKFPIPPQLFDVPNAIPEHIKWLYSQISEMMMLPQVKDLAKARQVPSGDSIEKLSELAGPGLTRISRRMEKSLALLGHMFMWLVFEFYTTKKKITYVGEDGITEYDLDYDPGNMVPGTDPDHPEWVGPDYRFQRCKAHGEKFFFRITPNSMHNLTQYTRKLMYLQMLKLQLPIDWWTIMDAFDIVNFGPPPVGTTNIMERYKAQRDIMMGWEIDKAKVMAEIQQSMQQESGPEGRPNSFNAPPHLVSKDGGTRTTTATSK